MRFPRILGAAALLALSVSAAAACDDYAEEMAMARAVKAAEAGKTAAAQPAQAAQPTEVAAPAAPPAQTAVTVSLADASRH